MGARRAHLDLKGAARAAGADVARAAALGRVERLAKVLQQLHAAAHELLLGVHDLRRGRRGGEEQARRARLIASLGGILKPCAQRGYSGRAP